MKPVARVTDKFDVIAFLADQYLLESINSIDKRFGEGYAKKNPQLVSTMVKLMQDCSSNNEGDIAILN